MSTQTNTHNYKKSTFYIVSLTVLSIALFVFTELLVWQLFFSSARSYVKILIYLALIGLIVLYIIAVNKQYMLTFTGAVSYDIIAGIALIIYIAQCLTFNKKANIKMAKHNTNLYSFICFFYALICGVMLHLDNASHKKNNNTDVKAIYKSSVVLLSMISCIFVVAIITVKLSA